MKTEKHPAFPVEKVGAYSGITILDYFAAKVMQGVLAGGSMPTDKDLSEWSYGRAKAMLKERAKNL